MSGNIYSPARRIISRVRRTGKNLAGKLTDRAIILVYHRVTDAFSDPQLLCVSPKHFQEHLAVLAGEYHPLSLSDLLLCASRYRVPDHAVAITFDDGYADNILQARPLLAAADIPATIFVASGYTDGRQEFWWDELERLILLPDRLPDSLSVDIDGRRYSWELAAHSSLSDNQENGSSRMDLIRTWNVTTGDVPSARHKAYLDLCSLLHPQSADRIAQVIDCLGRLVGDKGQVRPTHRQMTRLELHELKREGLIDIGAHTRRHLCLSAQPVDMQREEIAGSKRDLEKWLGMPVTSFSYPYGKPADYDRTAVSLVREAGFAFGLSNVQGWVTRWSDRYQFPRCLVRDWDGDEFSRRLRTFFSPSG